MNAHSIFNRTLLLMFAGDAEEAEYEERFITALNMALESCFDVENGLRRREGKMLLEAPQVVAKLEDIVDYDWRVCSCVPYYCASVLLAEDDLPNARSYQNQFNYEKSRLVQYHFEG